jgi:hypothetical protein
LNTVVDSCYSGSLFDLPFELFGNSKGADMDFSAVRFPHMSMVREHNSKLDNLMHNRGQRKTKAQPAKRQAQTLSHSPEIDHPWLDRDEGNLKDALKNTFPLESYVVLCGLKRNAQLSGKIGTIKSRLSKGCQ